MYILFKYLKGIICFRGGCGWKQRCKLCRVKYRVVGIDNTVVYQCRGNFKVVTEYTKNCQQVV
jgi:hypothetical protein